MGVVEEVGSGVTQVKPGDRVVIPFVIACGECFHCRLAEYAACETTNPGKGAALNQKGILPPAALFGYSHLYGAWPAARRSSSAYRRPTARCAFRTAWPTSRYCSVRHPAHRLPGRTERGRQGRLDRGDLRRRAGRVDECRLLPPAGRRDHFHGRSPALPPGLRAACLRGDADRLQGNRGSGRLHPYPDQRPGVDARIEAVGFEAEGSALESALTAVKLEGSSGVAIRQCIAAARRGGVVSIPGSMPVSSMDSCWVMRSTRGSRSRWGRPMCRA